MQTKNAKGRVLCICMGVYFVAKAVLNMIIGGRFSLSDLLIALVLACALLTGIKYVNYIAAAVLAFIALKYLPANISNISSNGIYLIEGAADIGCAALLCLQADIKENFSNTININK